MLEDSNVNTGPSPIPSRESQETMSPLLRLPAEIRNMIYEAMVEADCGCVPPCAKGLVPLSTLSEPPLTRVNRQLRQECLAVFYAKTRFSMSVKPGGLELCPTIPDHNIDRFFDLFPYGRECLPQEIDLRSVQAIQMSWSPEEVVHSVPQEVLRICVSLGLRSESRSARKLLIDCWSKFEVESAIFSALRISLDSEYLKGYFNTPELQQFVEMVWLCGANFPKATGHVELHAIVRD